MNIAEHDAPRAEQNIIPSRRAGNIVNGQTKL